MCTGHDTCIRGYTYSMHVKFSPCGSMFWYHYPCHFIKFKLIINIIMRLISTAKIQHVHENKKKPIIHEKLKEKNIMIDNLPCRSIKVKISQA